MDWLLWRCRLQSHWHSLILFFFGQFNCCLRDFLTLNEERKTKNVREINNWVFYLYIFCCNFYNNNLIDNNWMHCMGKSYKGKQNRRQKAYSLCIYHRQKNGNVEKWRKKKEIERWNEDIVRCAWLLISMVINTAVLPSESCNISIRYFVSEKWGHEYEFKFWYFLISTRKLFGEIKLKPLNQSTINKTSTFHANYNNYFLRTPMILCSLQKSILVCLCVSE